MSGSGFLTLSSALSADLIHIAIAFFSIGVSFHFCVRDLEIDYRLWRLAAVYVGLLMALLVAYVQICQFGIVFSVIRTSLASVSFNTGLTTSIILYRLLFHRLRSFPGPLGAKVSRFYAVSISAKGLQYHLELEKMHRDYGDFVRTGPREISINRASAVQAVNGAQTECRKSTWYSQVSDDVRNISLNSSRDLDDHKRRKRAWDRGLSSTKALAIYEPRVNSKIGVFISQLKSRQNQPVDATKWTMYLTFDVMGKIGFGKDYRQLEEGRELSAIKGLHDQMGALGLLSPVPWLLSLLGSIPGLSGSYGLFMDYCAEQVKEKKKMWESDKKETPTDMFSWLLKAGDDNDQSAPPGEGALNEDSRLIVIAGSDTTSIAMANALYYLTLYPSAYKRLQTIIDDIFPGGDSTFSYDQVNIPYLEGIINETLRLKPVIPSGQPRVTPPGGLQIDEVWIPGDVNVVLPQWVIQRDERYYERAKEFIPERWISGEDQASLIKDKDAFFPFQLGKYACAGKQLALMELRATISRIALNFDISFAPGEDGERFDKGARDTFVFTLEPLLLVFKERKR